MKTIAERIGRSLERAGFITRDIEKIYLAVNPEDHDPAMWRRHHGCD